MQAQIPEKKYIVSNKHTYQWEYILDTWVRSKGQA